MGFGFYFITFTQLPEVSANVRWDRQAIFYGKGENMSSQFPPEDSGIYKDILTGEWRVALPIRENQHPYLRLPETDQDFPPPIKKPTVGVIPRRVWLHQRAVDLSRAIANFSEIAGYSHAYDLIDELDEILEELKIPQQTLND